MTKKFLTLTFLFLLLFPQVALAQSGFQVLSDEVSIAYPNTVDFHVEIKADFAIQDVKLLYRIDSHSCQNGYAHQKVDFETNDTLVADWQWELKRSGTLPPGTILHWQWEITDTAGNTHQTELQELTIQDERNQWESYESNGVTVQWYVGDKRFGKDIHTIATNSIARLTTQMGLIADDNIHITVYPGANEVRDVLFAATEWVGGVAFPAYNATIIGVAPEENDWAQQVIPHELTHLLVGTMMFNCYGISAPTWLDEGLSEYGENAIDAAYRKEVTDALEAETLPKLSSLERGFSAYGTDARLSYNQSGVIVEYLISTYGQEQITELLLTMKAGETADDALLKVYGFDTNGLDREWRASLGYATNAEDSGSESQNPAEATAIPTLALSIPSNSSTATATSSENAIATTPTPVAEENIPTAPSQPSEQNHQQTLTIILVAAIIIFLLLIVSVIIIIVFLKRRKS